MTRGMMNAVGSLAPEEIVRATRKYCNTIVRAMKMRIDRRFLGAVQRGARRFMGGLVIVFFTHGSVFRFSMRRIGMNINFVVRART